MSKNPKHIEETFKYYASIFMGIGFFIIIFEYENFDNTINGLQFFWRTEILSVLLGLLSIIILEVKLPTVNYESSRAQLHLFILFSYCLFLPSIIGTINHNFCETEQICNNYKVINKGFGGIKKRVYYIYITIDDRKEERFNVPEQIYDALNSGENVKLCISKGCFNYYFVKSFNTE